ncbi:MAG: hypothetical protein OEQ28_09525 [Acidobacteriota bacterium]|nr:hypothetical protein [Acidobacteriota bacterium]
MSLLNDEQLENIEKQGKTRQIYKIEFFATILASIILGTFVLSRFVPEGVSSVPMVFETILFAIVIGLLSAPWAGRLMPIVFVGAAALFILLKIAGFSTTSEPGPFDSMWVWITGILVFAAILLAWKVISYNNPDNREAREYERYMRKIGRW